MKDVAIVVIALYVRQSVAQVCSRVTSGSCAAGEQCINQDLSATLPAYAGATSARSLWDRDQDLKICHPTLRMCTDSLDIGGSCTIDAHCKSQLCNANLCTKPRTLPMGAECGSDIACQEGYCGAGGRCALYALEGHPCSPNIATPTLASAPHVTLMAGYFKHKDVFVKVPTADSFCHPGFFADTRTYSVRRGTDPEYSLSKEPLRCKLMKVGDAVLQGSGLATWKEMTATGVCVKVDRVGKGGNCMTVQHDYDLLPGFPVLPIDPSGLQVGHCERGLYPKTDVAFMSCTCEAFVKDGKSCLLRMFGGRYRHTDKCAYGAQCVLPSLYPGPSPLMIGKCVDLLSGDADTFGHRLGGDAAATRLNLLCGKDYIFNEATNGCVKLVKNLPCMTNADCFGYSTDPSVNTVLCNRQAACYEDAAGILRESPNPGECVAIHSICDKELKDVSSFDLDRERVGERVSGEWGAYMKSISTFEVEYNRASMYTCCLKSKVDKGSTLWYHFGLHKIDTEATTMCDEPFMLIELVVSIICGVMAGIAFTVILIKDMIPTYKMYRGDNTRKDSVAR